MTSSNPPSLQAHKPAIGRHLNDAGGTCAQRIADAMLKIGEAEAAHRQRLSALVGDRIMLMRSAAQKVVPLLHARGCPVPRDFVTALPWHVGLLGNPPPTPTIAGRDVLTCWLRALAGQLEASLHSVRRIVRLLAVGAGKPASGRRLSPRPVKTPWKAADEIRPRGMSSPWNRWKVWLRHLATVHPAEGERKLRLARHAARRFLSSYGLNPSWVALGACLEQALWSRPHKVGRKLARLTLLHAVWQVHPLDLAASGGKLMTSRGRVDPLLASRGYAAIKANPKTLSAALAKVLSGQVICLADAAT